MEIPTKEQIEAVLEYLDYFKYPKEKPYSTDVEANRFDPNEYSGTVHRFVQTLYDNKLVQPFDWGEWQDEAKKYVENDALLKEGDIETIIKLFTSHVRKDRFCSRHLAGVIDNGHILKLLTRLELLAKE